MSPSSCQISMYALLWSSLLRCFAWKYLHNEWRGHTTAAPSASKASMLGWPTFPQWPDHSFAQSRLKTEEYCTHVNVFMILLMATKTRLWPRELWPRRTTYTNQVLFRLFVEYTTKEKCGVQDKTSAVMQLLHLSVAHYVHQSTTTEGLHLALT